MTTGPSLWCIISVIFGKILDTFVTLQQAITFDLVTANSLFALQGKLHFSRMFAQSLVNVVI